VQRREMADALDGQAQGQAQFGLSRPAGQVEQGKQRLVRGAALEGLEDRGAVVDLQHEPAGREVLDLAQLGLGR